MEESKPGITTIIEGAGSSSDQHTVAEETLRKFKHEQNPTLGIQHIGLIILDMDHSSYGG